MPELPEVETVVRDLRPLLVGKRLQSVRVGKQRLRRPWSRTWEPHLRGQTVHSLSRRGKWIVVTLQSGRHLVIHLGMTGQLTVESADQSPKPHTHVIFGLDGGREELRYCDIRRFGSVTFYSDAAALQIAFEKARLGPEPFELDANYWLNAVLTTRRCLKAMLLDQRVVAGVGNIYADESLFQARLHPAQLGCETSAKEATRLRRAIVTVLNRAIERRGSSIRNYVGGSGLQGEYQNEFRAYGRTGAPCLRCRTLLECIRLAGRSTHFCPQCQIPHA